MSAMAVASTSAIDRHGDAVEMCLQPSTNVIAKKHSFEKGARSEIAMASDEIMNENDESRAATKSTVEDSQHMERMGRSQQLVRHFRFLSISCLLVIALAGWEIGIFLVTPALLNGGRPTLLWGFLWNVLCFAPINLSMAEMASMAPIAGAQYHWVSEFAPDRLQKILSYFTGWTSTLAWQSGNALGVFLVATLIQSIILINIPDYSFPNWHATLLVIGALATAYAGNVFGSRFLPYWQKAAFIFHIVAFAAFIIPIWLNAPRVPSTQVWTDFENFGGWEPLPLAIMVGQLTGIYTQVGIDSACHMSEEVRDAARIIPKVMISVYLMNFVVTFIVFLTIAYHMPNVTHALEDPTLYPTIYVLRQSMSDTWITVLLVIIVALLVIANIAYLATITRDLFAFARDKGFPFSPWISKISEKRNIPINAIILSCALSVLLGLIYLGSAVAFYAITSLLTVALLQCYCLSIGCLLWRRIRHPETLPPAQFSLGKLGIPINMAAVFYSLWAFFWAFWPSSSPVTAEGFNWSSAIFVGVLIVAGLYYVFKARHVYTGPVALVKGRGAHLI